MATQTVNTAALILLLNTPTGLFYNSERGGFCATREEATRIENRPGMVSFIKAHFAKPENIVEVPAEDAPNSENAHLNPHLNGTLRVKPLPGTRWDSKHYSFGDWSIHCYRWNQNKGAHTYLRSTRPDYVPMWEAHNAKTGERFSCEDGGVKLATKRIIRHEMKRHGLV